MASEQNVEVIANAVTVHRSVGELTDPQSGQVTGVQNGRGKTYLNGAVIPRDAVTPDILTALEDEDHPAHESISRKLKLVSSRSRAGDSEVAEPFAGYDDLDEEEILRA